MCTTRITLTTLLSGLTLLMLLPMDDATPSSGGFTHEFLDPHHRILHLSCHLGTSERGVMSIIIYNVTSHTHQKLAWVEKGKEPQSPEKTTEALYLRGGFHSHTGADGKKESSPTLQVLLLGYQSDSDQRFGCNVSKLSQGTDFNITNYWTITVNRTAGHSTAPPSSSSVYTDMPKTGAAKAVEVADSDNLPMTVLIVMLVLISILLFLAVFLLLHKYRSRCMRREENFYHPPAYCLAADHLDWDSIAPHSLKPGSARTLNSRSHYSIAAHHFLATPPLPPLPNSTVPRRSYKRSASCGSGGSVHSHRVPYVSPQDALVTGLNSQVSQESSGTSGDGEVAALTSRQSQNGPLYACVPVSTTDND